MKVVSIGRSSQNDIVINDSFVGRSHLQIVQHDNGTFTLTDLNSINGTYVNGLRVSGQVILSGNDVIRIGNTILPWKSYFQIQDFNVEPLPMTVVQPSSSPIPASAPVQPSPQYYERPSAPLVDIPSNMNINKHESHEIISADVRKKGDDFSVGFRRKMGDNIGEHLGNTIGCIASIIVVIIFIAIIVLVGKGCS